jgi:hypothetical protein
MPEASRAYFLPKPAVSAAISISVTNNRNDPVAIRSERVQQTSLGSRANRAKPVTPTEKGPAIGRALRRWLRIYKKGSALALLTAVTTLAAAALLLILVALLAVLLLAALLTRLLLLLFLLLLVLPLLAALAAAALLSTLILLITHETLLCWS